MEQRKKRALHVRKLTFSALYLAMALVLPQLIGRIPQVGKVLSPMHIPVLLCGLVCGWAPGMAVGLIAPMLSSVMFGMPAMYPSAIAMTFELAAYGAVSGVLYRAFGCKNWGVYAALIIAMICGRLVWGAAEYLLLMGSDTPMTIEMFLTGAVIQAAPGIVLHIALIPPLVLLLKKAGLVLRA